MCVKSEYWSIIQKGTVPLSYVINAPQNTVTMNIYCIRTTQNAITLAEENSEINTTHRQT
jgi:hypothetical protein